jgi:tetratricopeptide (TPR) repeat protein
MLPRDSVAPSRSLGFLGFRHYRVSAVLVGLAGLAPSRAFAADETRPYAECTHEASDADLTAAKAAFQAGNVSFNEADYPRAILYWEDAFRRDCTAHPLLLNLARAYELNGQKRQAVVALETFLEREPNSTERAQIQRRIEVLKKQLDAEQAPVPTTAPPPPGPAPAAPAQPAEQRRGPVNLSEHPKSPQVLPLVVAGIGAAVFVVGGLIYLDNAGKVKDFEKTCGKQHNMCPPGYDYGPANKAATRETAGGVTALVGLPILAGGLIWYFVASSPSKSTAAVVTPAVGPGFYGVALNSRF